LGQAVHPCHVQKVQGALRPRDIALKAVHRLFGIYGSYLCGLQSAWWPGRPLNRSGVDGQLIPQLKRQGIPHRLASSISWREVCRTGT
jgi:hypothetical protein